MTKLHPPRIKTRTVTGIAYERMDNGPRFASVSPAADRAIHATRTQDMGFHRPKP